MKYFHYLSPDGGVLRVRAGTRPYRRPRPYVVRVFSRPEQAWIMPCFPEISGAELMKFIYLGAVLITKET